MDAAALVNGAQNQVERTEPQKVLAVDEGKVIFKADPLPEWVSRSLGAIIGPHTEKE